jgi:hypothetical protein
LDPEVACLSEENQKLKGVIGEVSLERDEDKFNTFNVTMKMIVDNGRPLSYDRGETLVQQFRKGLLGKKVELSAVVVACPGCGTGFNTEGGMKQHMRMIHGDRKGSRKRKSAKK